MNEFIEKLIERLEEAKFPIVVRRGAINEIPHVYANVYREMERQNDG